MNSSFDVPSSGDESTGGSTPNTSLSGSSHDASQAQYHIQDIQAFAKDLNNAAKSAFPNRGRSRYDTVNVCLIRWEEDHLNVDQEVKRLNNIFSDYGFSTNIWHIPSKDSHWDLMSKSLNFIRALDNERNLFIIYYGGHGRITLDRQAEWCCTTDLNYATVDWSSIQSLYAKAKSDVLILLDTCAAASSTMRPQHGVMEAIVACGFEARAPPPGEHSFTNTLIEVLDDWVNKRSFSASCLHTEILSQLKHKENRKDKNGKRAEWCRTPIHINYTHDSKAPGIELCRRTALPVIPPEPRPSTFVDAMDIDFDDSNTAPSPLSNTLPSGEFQVPHVLIKVGLEHHQGPLDVKQCLRWLEGIPLLAKWTKIEGIYPSYSTLIVLAAPMPLWNMFPDHPAISFVGYITAPNIAFLPRPEPAEPPGQFIKTETEVENFPRRIHPSQFWSGSMDISLDKPAERLGKALQRREKKETYDSKSFNQEPGSGDEDSEKCSGLQHTKQELQDHSKIQQLKSEGTLDNLGPERLSCLAELHQFIRELCRRGEFDMALNLNQRLLAATCCVYGKFHPDCFIIMAMILEVLLLQRNFYEAIDWCRHIRALRISSPHPENPDIVKALHHVDDLMRSNWINPDLGVKAAKPSSERSHGVSASKGFASDEYDSDDNSKISVPVKAEGRAQNVRMNSQEQKGTGADQQRTTKWEVRSLPDERQAVENWNRIVFEWMSGHFDYTFSLAGMPSAEIGEPIAIAGPWRELGGPPVRGQIHDPEGVEQAIRRWKDTASSHENISNSADADMSHNCRRPSSPSEASGFSRLFPQPGEDASLTNLYISGRSATANDAIRNMNNAADGLSVASRATSNGSSDRVAREVEESERAFSQWLRGNSQRRESEAVPETGEAPGTSLSAQEDGTGSRKRRRAVSATKKAGEDRRTPSQGDKNPQTKGKQTKISGKSPESKYYTSDFLGSHRQPRIRRPQKIRMSISNVDQPQLSIEPDPGYESLENVEPSRSALDSEVSARNPGQAYCLPSISSLFDSSIISPPQAARHRIAPCNNCRRRGISCTGYGSGQPSVCKECVTSTDLRISCTWLLGGDWRSYLWDEES